MACDDTYNYISEEPLWKGFTFHHFGLFLAAVFGFIALCIGLVLIYLHATHYLKPFEQRHIIRILLLIPIYSTVSFLSYLYYRHAIYFDILEGCYEAFAISSFFSLLCCYIAPNLHDQKDYFRTLTPVNWFWGVFGLQLCTGGENKGPFRKPRSGLTWFNVIWIGVFQYCFIRVFFTIVAVLAEVGGVYCEESLSPKYAHVWVQVIEAISVTIAMFCLIQFYIQLKDDLAEYRPFLKVLCIKLVIFFSFWQTIVISFASSDRGPLQPTKYLAYPDIKVGIPSVLLCIEMAIFAVMHIFAFSWKPYSIKHSYSDPLHQPGGGMSGGGDGASKLKYNGVFYALYDAFNPWDIIKMTARGFRWLFVGYRKRFDDVSYQTPSKAGANGSTSYTRPIYANSGEATTELRASNDDRSRRDTWEDDRAGLLGRSNRSVEMPSTNTYRPYDDAYTPAGGSEIDLGEADSRPPPLPRRPDTDFDVKPSEYDDDTTYHPHMGPSAGAGRADPGGAVHPAYRPDGAGGWPLSNDVENVRPPWAYRTDDAYR